MMIRKATFMDAAFIKLLLGKEGHQARISELVTQITTRFMDTDNEVWVFEYNQEVLGFAVIHELPQLIAGNNLLVVSQLVIEKERPDQNARMMLDNFLVELAKKRKVQLLRLDLHKEKLSVS